jgi:hypothetical protein
MRTSTNSISNSSTKRISLQRVNVVLKNRDEAFERLANLHKDNLQMFYPLKW